MDADRCTSALARISAAASRIEAAAGRVPATGDGELVRKHAALKAAVQETLSELDAMIGDAK
jgi:hypothetical protein